MDERRLDLESFSGHVVTKWARREESKLEEDSGVLSLDRSTERGELWSGWLRKLTQNDNVLPYHATSWKVARTKHVSS